MSSENDCSASQWWEQRLKAQLEQLLREIAAYSYSQNTRSRAAVAEAVDSIDNLMNGIRSLNHQALSKIGAGSPSAVEQSDASVVSTEADKSLLDDVVSDRGEVAVWDAQLGDSQLCDPQLGDLQLCDLQLQAEIHSLCGRARELIGEEFQPRSVGNVVEMRRSHSDLTDAEFERLLAASDVPSNHHCPANQFFAADLDVGDGFDDGSDNDKQSSRKDTRPKLVLVSSKPEHKVKPPQKSE